MSGQEVVRHWAQLLGEAVDGVEFTCGLTVNKGEFGFLEWTREDERREHL